MFSLFISDLLDEGRVIDHPIPLNIVEKKNNVISINQFLSMLDHRIYIVQQI